MFKIKNKINPVYLLRLFLGLVFLSAGIYRIFNWEKAILEFSQIAIFSVLPYYALIFTVALEIIGGLLLIFRKKARLVLFVFIVFLVIALSAMIMNNGKELLSNAGELFSFDATPTDVFLHFTYLVILTYLFFRTKK
ncbi:MAG: DoxX family protein [Candidatus Staskawiczbacteria bacterium]|nr:DoxX family protein [Candidatus Staskawiczbacteria bacterium]